MLRALVGALPAICNTQYEELLFCVTFSLAFIGAFRTSELVAKSRGDTSNRALRWGDLKIGQDMAELKVRHSRADQKGKGVVVRLRGLGTPNVARQNYSGVLVFGSACAYWDRNGAEPTSMGTTRYGDKSQDINSQLRVCSPCYGAGASTRVCEEEGKKCPGSLAQIIMKDSVNERRAHI
ncbi:hypothetical protein NDU88_006401 [Pleurodeles waltl]|uniref:Uncharacterized protein n=1 Tax=Pleurodeles waltl TaxID=8319 RepID=A0AAV7ULI0_PLEWA|nr:hypothetical protein NDU88_006401 [Pleurodeles waltl]